MLSQFVAQLFLDGLKAGTVKSYLTAVRHEQMSLGLGDPQTVYVRHTVVHQLKYDIKELQRKAVRGAARSRLPITPTLLGALEQVWSRDLDRFSASMLWAACCLCFFGFLRESGDLSSLGSAVLYVKTRPSSWSALWFWRWSLPNAFPVCCCVAFGVSSGRN